VGLIERNKAELTVEGVMGMFGAWLGVLWVEVLPGKGVIGGVLSEGSGIEEK
jgi:hypothetical protein